MFLNCFSHELLLALSQASLNAKVPVGHPEIWRKASSLVAQTVKSPPAVQETQVRSLGQEDPLENGMATHSSILAWRIPWTEELDGLQSMGSHRVGHN